MRFRARAVCARCDSRRGARGNQAECGWFITLFDEVNPLYAIFLYGKQEQADLTPQQKREVTGFAATIKAAARERRVKP